MGGAKGVVAMKIQRPVPYDENNDPNPFWKEGEESYNDPFDQFIPKGFISDMVYYFRGTEIPTVYTIWAALCAVSTVIKREAWIQWPPYGNLYANLYVILVGPAAGKKTTMVSFVIDLLRNYHNYIPSEEWRERKKLNILKNKATPEGILEMMIPTTKVDTNEDDEIIIRQGTSEMFLGLTEMSVMLNKQRYNEGLPQVLMDLYDTEQDFEWTTSGKKKKVLKNLYTTVLGATTPTAFKKSMPSEVIGDGFLSRIIVANSSTSNRVFWKPLPTAAGPDKDALMQRLAYISQASQATYTLSKEADEFGKKWYRRLKSEQETCGEDSGVVSRMNIHALQVAFLLHAQSYPTMGDKEISVETLQKAISLLNASHITSLPVVDTIRHSGGTEHVSRVKAYIMDRNVVLREKLQRAMQMHNMDSALVDKVLRYLLSQKLISVWELNMRKKKDSISRSKEYYKYEGKKISDGNWRKLGI